MERRVFVSGDGQIRRIGEERNGARLDGSGPLCMAGRALFCACRKENVIWRFDREQLIPTALFAGGPGVNAMLCSRDGRRLYVLCAEADSLLMVDADSGAPMILNRVGLSPHGMAMDETGETIAVAAGEYERTVLLRSDTLDVVRQLPMPGMVYAAVLHNQAVYSLCMTPALHSVLVTVLPCGNARSLALRGMPGALLWGRRALLAATSEQLYTVSADGARIIHQADVPGRAQKLLRCEGRILLHDAAQEALFACQSGVYRWRKLASGVDDAALTGE